MKAKLLQEDQWCFGSVSLQRESKPKNVGGALEKLDRLGVNAPVPAPSCAYAAYPLWIVTNCFALVSRKPWEHYSTLYLFHTEGPNSISICCYLQLLQRDIEPRSNFRVVHTKQTSPAPYTSSVSRTWHKAHQPNSFGLYLHKCNWKTFDCDTSFSNAPFPRTYSR